MGEKTKDKKRTSGRKKPEEPKKKVNPLHKDYSLSSNLKFIFGNLFKEEKSVLILIPLGIVAAPVMEYLWTFMSTQILRLVERNEQWKILFPVCAVFLVIQIISTMLNSYYWRNVWYRYVGVRMTLLTWLNKKAMTVNFEHLENPDVLDAFRKAQNSSGGNNEGVEGMMRVGVDVASRLAVAIVGFAIMSTLHPLIIVVLIITAVLSFIANDRTSAITKRTVWDVLSSWWRKNDYMNNICTNFSAAKDIRMYHLSDWLMGKKQELSRYRVMMQKKNEKGWLICGLIDRLLWSLSHVFLYWFIIRSVNSGKISIADAYLYVSASGAFYGSISSVLKNMTTLRQRNREVNDFRSFLDFDGGNLEDGELPMPEDTTFEIEFDHV